MAALSVATMIALSVVVGGAPADAAFPGRNGRIAFSTGFSHPSQIYTMRPNGTDVRQLTNVPRGGATSPDVSPDGTRIVFTFQRRIWVMNADGADQRQLTDQSGFIGQQASWSPDGRTILFSHCAVPFGFVAYCDIDSMNADGTGVTTVLGGNWIHAGAEYSPDGHRIAFSSSRGGYVSAVWVMNANGGALKRLTDPALQAYGPDWSPDGSHLLFNTHAELPGSQTWVMRADGSDQHQLSQFPPDSDSPAARYSPDGTKIVVLGPNVLDPDVCCWDVYFMNADGTNVHVIANGQPGVTSLDWAPRPSP
jgi:Tol biopolymer transport system component